MDFLNELIKVSEKAANVARRVRQDEYLFHLLVQQKKVDESNPRFIEDFKTLADVLIQEMIKYELEKKFPQLKGKIKGEESNKFSNKLGEEVVITIENSSFHTVEILVKVLNGDEKAAQLLSDEVHRTVELDEISTKKILENFDLNLDNLAIWIDPIDSTSEYISGAEYSVNGFHVSGLRSVTVLIGVYDLTSKEPVIGVINQPFLEHTDSGWCGRCIWGVSTETTKMTSTSIPDLRTNTICLSTSEDEEIRRRLRRKNFNLIEVAGAGYKILCVILGIADCYVLSKDSTFKWDTCGPQAVLRALGGDIVSYESVVRGSTNSLEYGNEHDDNLTKIQNCCNTGGILAYRNEHALKDIAESLTS